MAKGIKEPVQFTHKVATSFTVISRERLLISLRFVHDVVIIHGRAALGGSYITEWPRVVDRPQEDGSKGIPPVSRPRDGDSPSPQSRKFDGRDLFSVSLLSNLEVYQLGAHRTFLGNEQRSSRKQNLLAGFQLVALYIPRGLNGPFLDFGPAG